MGSATSVATYAGATEEGGTKAGEEVVAKMKAMGVDPESDEGKLFMKQLGAVETFKVCMDEFHVDENGAAVPYTCGVPGGSAKIKEGKEGDELAAAKKALSMWTGAYRLMNGAHHVAKMNDDIFDFFFALDPHPKMGLQRKTLVKKLHDVGVFKKSMKEKFGDKATDEAIAKEIENYVGKFMFIIGREKTQASLTEAQYVDALTKMLVAEMGPDGEKNWNANTFEIVDPTKCPLTVAVKKDLDKLDIKGEVGINFKEWRQYWLIEYTWTGAESTKKFYDEYKKFFGIPITP